MGDRLRSLACAFAPPHGARRLRGAALLTALSITLVWIASRDVTHPNPLFHPHGYCYLWQPPLVWTHVVSDSLIGLAYMTIPIALLSIVRRASGGLPFSGMLVAFGTFIIACGFTHFAEVLTLWAPFFWTAASLKVVTAIASVATALAVPPLVPKVLAMLAASRIAEERRVALERAHEELEGRVRERTRELTDTIEQLRAAMAARARAERQLGERDIQLRGILEHSPSHISIKDCRCRFVLVNRRLAEAHGGSPEHFLGRSNHELFPAPLAREYETNDRRALAGDTVQVEERYELADGAHVYLSSKFPLRNEAGEVVAIGAISTDITERTRLDEARAALLARERDLREEAERTNRQKDEFLATLSHELRTPLNAMLGYLRMLTRGLVAPERIPEVLAIIERNGQAQLRLVEELLDVSGIVTGRLALEIHAVDLADVARAALDAIQPAAADKRLTIDVRVPSPLLVVGDAARLRQVILNLLSNAVKFTPEGGAIQIDGGTGDRQVRLTVSDTGRGIDPSFLPHLFTPFRQADAGPTRSGGSLGLGLAIVRHLVEAHGGEVRAESRGPGQGAAFTIWLPAAHHDVPVRRSP